MNDEDVGLNGGPLSREWNSKKDKGSLCRRKCTYAMRTIEGKVDWCDNEDEFILSCANLLAQKSGHAKG